jgi:myo-inositol 2-dehydrogenase/D-chiro-inositol 1-dehydrogenase/scyllo-inositol 2-dehydrogenase (NAD+)
MSKKNIGVCLIGAGRAGMIHGINFKKSISNADMVAVVDPFEEAAIKACKTLEIEKYYTDYKLALEDDSIDAVVIVTPTIFHKDIAVAAAYAGKHIFCEKPMAMNEDECEQMIAAATKNNVKLQIGFMRRFDASFLEAKQAVSDGVIGDVVLVRSLTRGPSKPQQWMYDIDKSNGPLAEVNSHDIDTARWFAESELKSVYAIAGNFRSRKIASEFPKFYDNVLVSGIFYSGVQLCIDGAQYVKYGYDARVEILGTDGLIMLGNTQQNSLVVCNKDKKMTRPFMSSWTHLFTDAYLAEDEHFIECILEDKTPRVSGIDGKMAVKIVRACNQSITDNSIVELKY